VAEGDLVVVLEAMKMEQPLNAHKAGSSPISPPRSAHHLLRRPLCRIT